LAAADGCKSKLLRFGDGIVTSFEVFALGLGELLHIGPNQLQNRCSMRTKSVRSCDNESGHRTRCSDEIVGNRLGQT
jgi:hypothetical protein